MMFCNLVFFLVNLIFITNCDAAAEYLDPPASDFSRHSIVQPIVQHARTKRNINTTRDENLGYTLEMTVKIVVDNEEYILDLRMNQDLVPNNYVFSYQENGKTVLQKYKKEEIDFCHYSGSVRDKPNSWVALSTCHGIQGVMFDGSKMRYIEPAQGGHINSKHYVYDQTDLIQKYQCGYDSNSMNQSDYTRAKNINNKRIKRYKRRVSNNRRVHGPYKADKASRYVELVLVADNREYRANRNDHRAVERRMKSLVNIINALYSPLNIFIALVGVVVWSERDKIQLESDGDRTLNNFLEYRQRVLVKQIPNDNAHLITGQELQNEIFGKALRHTMCSYNSGGVEYNHTPVLGLFATTIAHEMGHNFGMEHDEDFCQCPDEKCIMSPTSTKFIPVNWSSCSLNSLAIWFDKGIDYCLRNKPKRLLDPSTCGNGFVESNEQCDCGVTILGSYNPCHACCDPKTCRLRSNATCATGICCDIQTCRIKTAGAECRIADRECDLPEYCTGHSEYCPDDVYKMDTTPCGKGSQRAYCVNGNCRSHTDQCRLLWGVTGVNGQSSCYNANLKGDKYGHCGYDNKLNTYLRCKEQNVLCGVLKCFHLGIDPQIGEKRSYPTQIVKDDRVRQCENVDINLSYQDTDPAMVPDGAICGHEMMCLKQKCVSVAALREKIRHIHSSVCPSNCSGRGVCNSAGHCHCDPGFGPPLCAVSGHGGSYESGPVIDTISSKVMYFGLLIIVIAILLIILLILLCFRSKCKINKSNNNLIQTYTNIE